MWLGKLFGKSVPKPTAGRDLGDVSVQTSEYGIMKAYIPEFLYKPPFGYPRKENLPLIRTLAKNPYIFSVIKTLCDEAASTKFDIVYKDGVEPSAAVDKIRQDIFAFFDNPNQNKESFQAILRAVVKDVCEVDAGVIVKVFNFRGEFKQIFARDGASFLKNPDPHGYLGNRAEFVMPSHILPVEAQPGMPLTEPIMKQYSMEYKESAAYFQYGTTAMALPVPFGRRELIYVMQNPRSDTVYGLSPVQLLADIIMTLVYGSNYNLDFYMNNNMPEGVLQIIDANKEQITAFRDRLDKTVRVKDAVTGFMRKVGFKVPISNKEAKFTPFQLDPQVMQIIEQQQWFTKLVWACFGVTADEMGFTENSNRAVGQVQHAIYKRKAVRPILALLKYHIDKELIPEWGREAFESLEFKWDDYDLEEDIRRHSLYEAQLRMGIVTPKLIAEKEGIDYDEVKEYQDEKHKKELERAEAQSIRFQQRFGKEEQAEALTEAEKLEEKSFVKSEGFDNELEAELVNSIKKRGRELIKALDQYKKGELDKIK